MAPNDPIAPGGDTDPDTIDVKLSILGEGGLEAVNALTEQLRRNQEVLAQLSTTQPEGRLHAGRVIAGRRTGTGVHHGTHEYTSLAAEGVEQAASGRSETGSTDPRSGDPTLSPESGVSPAASLPWDESMANASVRQRLAHVARVPGGLGQKIDAWNALYAAREREQAGRRGMRGLAGQDFTQQGISAGQTGVYGTPGAPVSGIPSPMASVPEGSSPGTPTWYQSLQADPVAFEKMQEGFRVPQFGEFQLTDKLEMARNFFASRAVRQYQNEVAQQQTLNPGMTLEAAQTAAGQAGAGANQGRMASLLNQAAANSGQIFEARRQAQRLYGFAQGQSAAGASLGYRTDGGGAGSITIPGTNIGFRNPLGLLPGVGSDATREGWRIWADQMQLKASPGINGEQAKAITENLTGLGWSGTDFHNVALNAIAPLVRQGQDPNVITPMVDQALRNGQNSIKDVVNTFTDLGTAARAARLPLTEFTQGVEEFSTAAEQAGGTRLGGAQSAIQYTRATGMAPQIGSALMQNPFVQATAMRTMGILPSEVGSLTGGQLSNVSTQALRTAMQLAAPLNRPTIEHTPGGDITTGGFTHQIGQAAQTLGITTDQARRMWQARNVAPARATAEDMLTQFGEEASHLKKGVARRVFVPGAPQAGGAPAPGHWATVRDSTGEEYLEHGGTAHDKFINWQETAKELRTAGISQRDITKLENIDDPVKRAKAAEADLSALSKKNLADSGAQQVQIKFTGMAAKFFEQVGGPGDDKAEANAGGKAINTKYVNTFLKTHSWDELMRLLKKQGG